MKDRSRPIPTKTANPQLPPRIPNLESKTYNPGTTHIKLSYILPVILTLAFVFSKNSNQINERSTIVI